MSGGYASGSRVSTATMREIQQLQRDQQIAADLAAMQQPGDVDALDLDWEPAESPDEKPEQEDTCMQEMPGDSFLDKPEQPRQPCLYENLPDGHFEQTTLYDIGLQQQPDAKFAREILHDTFFKNEGKADLEHTLERFKFLSNHQVLKVESVLNKPLWCMHEMFKRLYKIEDTRTHYHGSDHADVVARNGFRGSCSQRSRWGKGIYNSSDPWEAFSYCNGDVMKMIITLVHIGPHTGGWQDRIDYGVDANGKPNLTLTDPSGTIFCCAGESQLLPTAIVTVRYMNEIPNTAAHYAFVKQYSKRVWNIINSAPSLGAGGAGGAANAAVATPGGWIQTQHHFFAEGHVVTVKDGPRLDAKYKEYADCTCVIRKIINKGQCYFFFLQVVFDKDGKPVDAQTVYRHIAQMNIGFFKPYEGRDRCCLIVKPSCVEPLHGPIFKAAIDAGAAAWADSVGAPPVGAGSRAGFPVAAAAANEYADSLHYHYAVDKEVYIQPALTKNKQNKKYEKFVGWRGTIKRIMAKDGKDFYFFVYLTHDENDKPATPEIEMVQLNGGGYKFLKGPDERRILNCLPCKAQHIYLYNDYSRKRAELMRAKRAIDAMIDAGDQGGATKKPRPGDDGPAGGSAGQAAPP